MSKIGDWVLDLEQDAVSMTRNTFIRVHGKANVDVWDRVQGTTPDPYQNQDPEEYYYPGSDPQE